MQKKTYEITKVRIANQRNTAESWGAVATLPQQPFTYTRYSNFACTSHIKTRCRLLCMLAILSIISTLIFACAASLDNHIQFEKKHNTKYFLNWHVKYKWIRIPLTNCRHRSVNQLENLFSFEFIQMNRTAWNLTGQKYGSITFVMGQKLNSKTPNCQKNDTWTEKAKQQ